MNKCIKCGYEWESKKKGKIPKCCVRCKQFFWDRPRGSPEPIIIPEEIKVKVPTFTPHVDPVPGPKPIFALEPEPIPVPKPTPSRAPKVETKPEPILVPKPTPPQPIIDISTPPVIHPQIKPKTPAQLKAEELIKKYL